MSLPFVLALGCSAEPGSPTPAQGGQVAHTGGQATSTGGQNATTGGQPTSTTGGQPTSTGGQSTSTTGGQPTGTTGGQATATGGQTAGTTGGQSTGGTGGQATQGGNGNSGGTSGGSSTAGGNGGAGKGGSNTGGTTGGSSSTGGSGGAGKGGSNNTGGSSGGNSTSTGGTSTGGTSTGGTASSGECDVWVAPTGTSSAPGSEAQPADLLHGYDLLCPPPPSGTANGAACLGSLKTMCLKSGTYTMTTRFELKKTRMGTASRVLTIRAAPNATTRPLLDFSTQPRVSCGANPSDGNLGGITINADYWTVKGIEVKGANDNCVKVQGQHDVVENVAVHECADTGIQISAGSGYTGSGTNNLILNCDSYKNFDSQCDGENADGFGAKEEAGAGNVFRGCRSWDNVDDGYDFYAWTSPITLENCWSWSNAVNYTASERDGNGFKLGGDDKGGNHNLKTCIAVSNRMHGFTNNSGANSTCTGCRSCNNADADQGINGSIGTSCPSVAQLSAARGADGALPTVP
jgi:hypothetical protein